ncbi:MAG: DNA methyltransferase [Chitinophagaceae bacterium]
MALSWNEIKHRAAQFSKEWDGEQSEDAEAKSFWDGFFNIFGISRRRVATFEHLVHKLEGKQGFIDLLWKGTILIEHKSKGKDLDRAYQQAKDYFPGLKNSELPKYILVSDFERFRLFDLDTDERHDFLLKELVDKVHLFDFIAGYQKRSYKDQDPVNIEAAEMMGRLHDSLKAIGYAGHRLERYLVRLLFCLFADDTTIFEKGIFYDFIDQRTAEDGSDLARSLAELFEVLNTPNEERMRNLDEQLAAFPYVNGKLFEEHLPIASFDATMRQTLLDCCALDWGKISPAIFGSLFQSVMDEKARRNLGAHYTSERNIMKLIKPLFLDALWAEYEGVKNSKGKLQTFHKKLSALRFLDPACGCGNFLIIAYREVRLLELEILKTLLFKHGKLREEVAADARIDVGTLLRCDVDKFYGIEYEEFPAQIAQVAMWLIDHQMNMAASEAFGEYYVRLPLRKSAMIVQGNALRIEWQSLLQRDLRDLWNGEKEDAELRYDYILGNPPFVGSKMMTEENRADIEVIFNGVKGAGTLDYVAGWYGLAGKYLAANTTTKVGFVSTNSIVQGEQVSILWGQLLRHLDLQIHFAHQTFQWTNEARGVAAVHCIIVGFGQPMGGTKRLFLYEDIRKEPVEIAASNINAYLVEGREVLIASRQKPLCDVPELSFGNMPLDGGHLLLSDEEKIEFALKEPNATKFIRPLISAREFLNGQKRWCLWLDSITPVELKTMPLVMERIQAVKSFRGRSIRIQTKNKAETPALFGEIRSFGDIAVVIPRVSSENRQYIPMGFFGKESIVGDTCMALPNASLYHFGILTSKMHMAWVKYVGGRLKSDYRYSKDIIYNNFPWPENPTEKNKQAVEAAAQAVLDARAAFPGSSLADLYDPLTMPPLLAKAHAALDRAVDVCYRPQPFPNDAKRMELLFELYERFTGGMFATEKTKKKR